MCTVQRAKYKWNITIVKEKEEMCLLVEWHQKQICGKIWSTVWSERQRWPLLSNMNFFKITIMWWFFCRRHVALYDFFKLLAQYLITTYPIDVSVSVEHVPNSVPDHEAFYVLHCRKSRLENFRPISRNPCPCPCPRLCLCLFLCSMFMSMPMVPIPMPYPCTCPDRDHAHAHILVRKNRAGHNFRYPP